MEIVYKPLNELKEYENNPRNNDGTALDKVAMSIKEYGFKVPIIIDTDNVIVAGHTRVKAAKRLQLEKVPCIIADDLTPTQIKAFRLADNKTAEYATWDNELLTLELGELQEIDLELTGFDDWEIEHLLNPVTDDDIADFFVDKEPTEKEPKKIQCPLCGGEFEK